MKTLRIISFLALTLISVFASSQNFVEITSKKEFQESADNHINSAVLTADGYHVVTGYTYNNSKGGKDIWVAKLSVSGEIIWQKTFGDINNDEGVAIIES